MREREGEQRASCWCGQYSADESFDLGLLVIVESLPSRMLFQLELLEDFLRKSMRYRTSPEESFLRLSTMSEAEPSSMICLTLSSEACCSDSLIFVANCFVVIDYVQLVSNADRNSNPAMKSLFSWTLPLCRSEGCSDLSLYQNKSNRTWLSNSTTVPSGQQLLSTNLQ